MFITNGDTQLYTVRFGAGSQTFVAQGGWIGSWEMWAEPFGFLSQHWQTIGFDHRGCGATITTPESISVPAMVSDLFAVLDALDVDQCVLGAESAGTIVALEAALAQPQRFRGLVLVGAFYHQDAPAGQNPFAAALRANYPATLNGFARQCIPDQKHAAFFQWGLKILERAVPAAAIRLAECNDGIDLRPRLAEIRIPTLVIHGSDDRIVPVQAGQALAAQLPYSQFLLIEGGGHVPTLTHGEQIASAVQQMFG